jgi:hypothetical protein
MILEKVEVKSHREAAEVEVLIEVVSSRTSSEDSFVCSQPIGAKVFGESSVASLRLI